LRSGFESRAAHLEKRLGAVLLVRREDGIEEAWEALVQFVVAEGEQAAAAFGAGAYYAALAEHAEVVGEGGL
jgi:hypothetical protein